MYSLTTLRSLNARAVASKHAAENETTRHCSFCESKQGLVLHSAKKRSTVFLSTASAVKSFLNQYWGTNSVDKRDSLVESYFN